MSHIRRRQICNGSYTYLLAFDAVQYKILNESDNRINSKLVKDDKCHEPAPTKQIHSYFELVSDNIRAMSLSQRRKATHE